MASPGPAPHASPVPGPDAASTTSDIFRRHDPSSPPSHPPSPSRASLYSPSQAPLPPASPAPQPRQHHQHHQHHQQPPFVPLASSPVRRKPLASTAASLPDLPAFATTGVDAREDEPQHRFVRPQTIDSPTLYDFSSSSSSTSAQPLASAAAATPLRHSYQPSASTSKSPPATNAEGPAARNIPCLQAASSHLAPAPELSDVLSDYDDLISQGSASPAGKSSAANTRDDCSADDIDPLRGDDVAAVTAAAASPAVGSVNNNLLPPPMFAPRPVPPHLRFHQVDTSLSRLRRQSIPESTSPESERPSKPTRSKSPSQASPFASLFAWTNPSPSVTDFSSVLSPLSPARRGSTDDALLADQPWLHSPKANAAATNPINYCESYLSTPPPPQALSFAQVEEMEEELKAIGSELAASIRREMDLEELVDRLQDQVNNPQAPGKRTSDYFSDSGYSSAKLSEHEPSREEVDKIQRRAEQEKASIRLELTNKLQDERSKRKALDQQIKELAEKASQMDLAHINTLDANHRVRDLENLCEDLRRRLSEERDSKDNFEDLLAALKGELRVACNERDNLRDEVVPHLRARVEGLETEAASYANLTYESTKMQQQLQSLRQENSTLRYSPSDDLGALSRSNSGSLGALRSRSPLPPTAAPALAGAQNAPVESREQLSERPKDVEAQRDALHGALKNLLERQEFQNRENQKKIEMLEGERQRLLAESPQKAGFARDIANLRTEINVLRRRAEEALEQKWQVEKGLVGLKMDLDRAEEEIASLQSLLRDKDILIPPSTARSSSPTGVSMTPISSESLERAYRELQDAYRDSLERIKKLEADAGEGISSEKTKLAMERLEQAVSAANIERDAARQHATGLEGQISGLRDVESRSLGREKQLADELSDSAQRVEQLATQVRQQLARNAELRDRLTETVAKGDADRKANSGRISSLQERLHALEEKLLAVQAASEERVGQHEEELSRLRDAHNEQLRRLKTAPLASKPPATRTTLLRPDNGPFFSRSSQGLMDKSLEDTSLMRELRDRVTELEKALADAEEEIQQVVGKMSEAQMEVITLQEEREAALRETRRLQKTLVDEQAKAFEDRFKSLNPMVKV